MATTPGCVPSTIDVSLAGEALFAVVFVDGQPRRVRPEEPIDVAGASPTVLVLETGAVVDELGESLGPDVLELADASGPCGCRFPSATPPSVWFQGSTCHAPSFAKGFQIDEGEMTPMPESGELDRLRSSVWVRREGACRGPQEKIGPDPDSVMPLFPLVDPYPPEELWPSRRGFVGLFAEELAMAVNVTSKARTSRPPPFGGSIKSAAPLGDGFLIVSGDTESPRLFAFDGDMEPREVVYDAPGPAGSLTQLVPIKDVTVSWARPGDEAYFLGLGGIDHGPASVRGCALRASRLTCDLLTPPSASYVASRAYRTAAVLPDGTVVAGSSDDRIAIGLPGDPSWRAIQLVQGARTLAIRRLEEKAIVTVDAEDGCRAFSVSSNGDAELLGTPLEFCSSMIESPLDPNELWVQHRGSIRVIRSDGEIPDVALELVLEGGAVPFRIFSEGRVVAALDELERVYGGVVTSTSAHLSLLFGDPTLEPFDPSALSVGDRGFEIFSTSPPRRSTFTREGELLPAQHLEGLPETAVITSAVSLSPDRWLVTGYEAPRAGEPPTTGWVRVLDGDFAETPIVTRSGVRFLDLAELAPGRFVAVGDDWAMLLIDLPNLEARTISLEWDDPLTEHAEEVPGPASDQLASCEAGGPPHRIHEDVASSIHRTFLGIDGRDGVGFAVGCASTVFRVLPQIPSAQRISLARVERSTLTVGNARPHGILAIEALGPGSAIFAAAGADDLREEFGVLWFVDGESLSEIPVGTRAPRFDAGTPIAVFGNPPTLVHSHVTEGWIGRAIDDRIRRLPVATNAAAMDGDRLLIVSEHMLIIGAGF